MTTVGIYSTSSGKLDRIVCTNYAEIDLQLRDGEDFYLNCPMSAGSINLNTFEVVLKSTDIKYAQELL